MNFSIDIEPILKSNHRGDKKVNQLNYFNFAKMLRMSPKNEGPGPRPEGWVLYDRAMDLELVNLIADLENIQKEIVKIADFSNISKEDLMNRINILLIDEKILNKRNRNLDSYYVNDKTPLITKHLIISFHLILPLTIQNQFSPLLRK